MVTRNVVITDQQAELIETLISNGRYQNASEVLRAGLRLVEREEAELDQLRRTLMDNVEEARQGKLSPGTGAQAMARALETARRRNARG
jgi:antitoxin ParD1/3/4